MDLENKENFEDQNQTIYNDEIDLKKILRTIYRKKVIVITLTSIATFSNIIFTTFQKSIYQGSFEIVVM